MNLEKQLISNIQHFKSSSGDEMYILEKLDGSLYKGIDVTNSPYEVQPVSSKEFLEILKDYHLIGDRNLEQRFGFIFNELSPKEIEGLLSGRQEDIINITLNKEEVNLSYLEKEKIDYEVSGDSLSFKSKVNVKRHISADSNEETRNGLTKNKIKFEVNGNKLRIAKKYAGKILMTGLFLANPLLATLIILRPKRKEIKNDQSLSSSDIKQLKEGKLISKVRGNEKVLMQVDPSTNEVVTVRAREINIPNRIEGLLLSPIEKEQLRKGHEINVSNDKGEVFNLRLDLNSKSGIHKSLRETTATLDKDYRKNNSMHASTKYSKMKT